MKPIALLPMFLAMQATACDGMSLSMPSGATSLPGSTTHAMEGVELISWQTSDGAWHYALPPGTNRLKSREEVMSHPSRTTEVARLKFMLSSLRPGQSVVWRGLPDDADFLLPTYVVVEISGVATSHNLNLAIARH